MIFFFGKYQLDYEFLRSKGKSEYCVYKTFQIGRIPFPALSSELDLSKVAVAATVTAMRTTLIMCITIFGYILLDCL